MAKRKERLTACKKNIRAYLIEEYDIQIVENIQLYIQKHFYIIKKFLVGKILKINNKNHHKVVKKNPIPTKKERQKTFSVQKNPNPHQLHMNHYVNSSFRQSY